MRYGFSKEKVDQAFEEESHKMMKELEAYYKSIQMSTTTVRKGALEMNMFSPNRETFESMIVKSKTQKEFIWKLAHDGKKYEPPPKEDIKVNQFGNVNKLAKAALGQPSQRKLVEVLENWLETMMTKALAYKETVMDDFEQRKFAMHQMKVILTIALWDLIW